MVVTACRLSIPQVKRVWQGLDSSWRLTPPTGIAGDWTASRSICQGLRRNYFVSVRQPPRLSSISASLGFNSVIHPSPRVEAQPSRPETERKFCFRSVVCMILLPSESEGNRIKEQLCIFGNKRSLSCYGCGNWQMQTRNSFWSASAGVATGLSAG